MEPKVTLKVSEDFVTQEARIEIKFPIAYMRNLTQNQRKMISAASNGLLSLSEVGNVILMMCQLIERGQEDV